jgi:hypothetical protein
MKDIIDQISKHIWGKPASNHMVIRLIEEFPNGATR